MSLTAKIWSRSKAEATSIAAEHTTGSSKIGSEKTPENERWIGFIDKIDRRVIVGWCMDRQEPTLNVAVEAIGSNGGYAFAIAGLFRRDVMESGYGSGHHGFELDVSDFGDDESVTVRFLVSGQEITTAPIALDPVSAALGHDLPSEILDAARKVRSRMQIRYRHLEETGLLDDVNDRNIDSRLLETFDESSDAEGLVTRFMAQEASRIVRAAFDNDIRGALQDRLGVLLWYVDSYAAARPSSARVPLSARQIEALNAPAPLAGASAAVTIALFNFVLTHKPSHIELRSDRFLREAVFWWCTQQANALRLDDQLVTPDQISLLATVERGSGSQFPCTTFMTLYASQHPELGELDLGVARDRLVLSVYLVLASFVDPGLLRFLPRETLRKLSRAEDTLLAALIGRLVASGDEASRLAAGTDMLRKGKALLAAAGYSLGSKRAVKIGAQPAASSTPQPGICVVGPLRKSSGLGRAVNLSVEALALSEVTPPVLCDFAMENPAAQIRILEASTVKTGSDQPREITLLHLNAEVLPLALAYGPRHLLADTYRIGFFFWELTEIPECHRLALDLVDEIWVASEFNREIYARSTDKPVIRVGMAAPNLPEVAPASREDWGLDRGAFTFVAVFDSLSFIARKNPLGVIEAFARAFPHGDEPVALVLKTQNRGLVQDEWQVRNWRAIDRGIAADPRIVLVDETLAFPDLLALMRACDAYVSLHRSEGWGFGIVEAMQLGLPVVCTGWSGNAEFCTEETAFLVPHSLIPVGTDEYIYTPHGSLWADPSIEAAAEQLRLVSSDKSAAARKAGAARAFVATHLGLEVTAKRYGERLAAIRGGMRKAGG